VTTVQQLSAEQNYYTKGARDGDEEHDHVDDSSNHNVASCPGQPSFFRSFGAGQVHNESGRGPAFSDFRGYESWQLVSISHNGEVYAAILANPIMIDAIQAGIPDNGEPFPDGAKMAKFHWIFEEPTFIYGANANGLLGKRSDIAARGLTKDIVVARLERKHEQRHRRVQIL